MAELASFYGQDCAVGQVLRRMRCSGACGGRVGAAWLVTGPILNTRVRPRRVPLLGSQSPSRNGIGTAASDPIRSLLDAIRMPRSLAGGEFA